MQFLCQWDPMQDPYHPLSSAMITNFNKRKYLFDSYMYYISIDSSTLRSLDSIGYKIMYQLHNYCSPRRAGIYNIPAGGLA